MAAAAMREDVQGFRWPRSFQEQPRLLRRRPLTGVVVSQSMSIKRQCEGSGSATSSCADLRAAYHNCFNRRVHRRVDQRWRVFIEPPIEHPVRKLEPRLLGKIVLRHNKVL
ncbi:hypothetical protein SDJN02_07879, partial [Cucurbita argyrosperma subsp. argyrosperma]